jgi:hypothetical protein
MTSIKELAGKITSLSEELVKRFGVKLQEPPFELKDEISLLDLTDKEWSKKRMTTTYPRWEIELLDSNKERLWYFTVTDDDYYEKDGYSLIVDYDEDREVTFLRLLDGKKENKYGTD